MSYYSSVTCGYNGSEWVETGCTNAYEQSEVKYVVDAWKAAKASAATEARLLTYEEVSEYAETKQVCNTGNCYEVIGLKYDWMYNNNYWYWTMSSYNDISFFVWNVELDGRLANSHYITSSDGAVRPVIVLPKSAL